MSEEKRYVVCDVQFTEDGYLKLHRISANLRIPKEEALDRAISGLYMIIFGREDVVMDE